MCYCRDCQAFAHFLGKADEMLDAQNGSQIIQTLPAYVTFTQGQEMLACMRLSPKGMLRWYCTCCNTPIGNTLDSPKISFIGLVHICLDSGGASLDEVFGPIRMRVNTKSAKGAVTSSSTANIAGILRVMAMVARARLDGSYRHTPFFSGTTGAPIVTPRVISLAEKGAIYGAL